MNFYYGDLLRLDWGLGNPNRTAALIASLMVACWALSYFRKWGFWLALVLFSALGVCLVQTFSRGGLVGLLAGGTVLLVFANRPWPRTRVISVLAALALLIGCAIYLSAHERYASSWQGDPSVTNRLELWKSVPKMIVTAPNGWELGQSQEAYMQWYQAPEREERFLNLVSLHFTLLAELGWPWRILYLLLCAGGFVLTFPGKGFSAVPFGIWTTTFVAGIFTHFSTSWPVYLPAILALGVALSVRTLKNSWPSRRVLVGAAALVLLGIGCIYGLGSLPSSPLIRVAPSGIIVGEGLPEVWVCINRKVLGNSYGKALRKYLASRGNAPTLEFVTEFGDIPQQATVVVCGETLNEAGLQKLSPRKLILLNPNLTPQQLDAIPTAEKHVIFGEFSQSPTLQAWKANAQIVSGSGDFLPSWPQLVFEHLR